MNTRRIITAGAISAVALGSLWLWQAARSAPSSQPANGSAPVTQNGIAESAIAPASATTGLTELSVVEIADKLVEESSDSFLYGANAAYRRLELMATTERARQFGGSIRPERGFEHLFTPVTVSSEELVEASLRHVITRIVDEEPPREERIDVASAIRQGKLPLLLYDTLLESVQTGLLEEKLLLSFFRQAGLAPADEDVIVEVTADARGGLLSGRAPHSREVMRLEAGDAQAQIDAMKRRLVRASAAVEFRRRRDTIVPVVDQQRFFKTPAVVDEREIINFLRSHSVIATRIPAELQRK